MTHKQSAFVGEYLIDLNASNAPIRAGYSQKTAYSIGQENLKKPEISAAIEGAILERSERTQITQDYVLEVIRDTIERCRTLSPITDSRGNPILVITSTGQTAALCAFKPLAVLRGAELLGRHLNMWPKRGDSSQDLPDSLAERLEKARERVLSQMSDAELQERIKELEGMLSEP
jgi:phage terminase small subunit